LATITIQNYFRMYDKLAGMTGTAVTEEGEFIEIYELPVMLIPTNVPISRQDHDGEPGSVTIATNMAGRGTDIKLGEGVVSLEKSQYLLETKKIDEENPFGRPIDGLHVIGTERHESRRIDRQLRGRAGRQGDPGTSRFYLSLEDDLMRLFGSDRIAPMLSKLGMDEDEAITHPWMTATVEKAQKKVEGHNFETRKQLIKYDEVMNSQREIIYRYRRNVLEGYDLKSEIQEMIHEFISNKVYDSFDSVSYQENWDFEPFIYWFKTNMNISISEADFADCANVDDIDAKMWNIIIQKYDEKEEEVTSDEMRELERYSLLTVVDDEWRDHLHEMDLLKEGISFRAYAQKDPLIEYKKESLKLFENLIFTIQENVAKKVFTTYIIKNGQIPDFLKNVNLQHASSSAFSANDNSDNKKPEKKKIAPRRVEKQPERNAPCPCGSGKKYKNCCGKRV